MWKARRTNVSDPKLTTLDVKSLGPTAAPEIGTFNLKTSGALTEARITAWLGGVGNWWQLAAEIWNDGR
jgi:hypothetical protein